MDTELILGEFRCPEIFDVTISCKRDFFVFLGSIYSYLKNVIFLEHSVHFTEQVEIQYANWVKKKHLQIASALSMSL